MLIGEILVAHGLATQAQVANGLARQKRDGGLLGATLVAMDVLTVEQLLVALKFQRESAMAVDFCESTLRRCRALYGPVHPNTSGAHDDLARALLKVGRPDEAIKHAELAAAGYAQLMGPNHEWSREATKLVADARRAATTQRTTVDA